MVARELYGVDSRALIEALEDADAERFPTLAGVLARLSEQARSIQDGGPEYRASAEHLGVWWPMDQVVLIDLVARWRLDHFHAEVAELLGEHLAASVETFDPELWNDACTLNRRVFKRPFFLTDDVVELAHDVWELYGAALVGESVEIARRPAAYRIHRTRPPITKLEDWCEYLILCQNHKSGYLCPVEPCPAAAPAAG